LVEVFLNWGKLKEFRERGQSTGTGEGKGDEGSVAKRLERGGGTTDLRNLWYGFVGKGTINKVDWNEGRVTALLGRDGPNGVRWIFSCGREIAEGLAIIEPCLPNLGGGVRKIDGHVLIRLIEALVAFFAEILEGLGIDQLLKFGLEGLL
jgi:hypothetical protein